MKDFLHQLNGHYPTEKKAILALCENNAAYSLADFAKELNTSIPKISRIVGEMVEEGYLADLGKQESASGRRPSIYGLNPGAGFFVGIDVEADNIAIAVTDFPGRVVHYEDRIAYKLENNEASVLSFCKEVIGHLGKAGIDRKEVRAYGVSLTGRVNPTTGYSYSYFISEEQPILDILERGFEAPVAIGNDSSVMAYGEYVNGGHGNVGTFLFLNVGWGLGMGIVLGGKLFHGKSGFSGELGHVAAVDNGILCRCGKRGCLETAASGIALHRQMLEKLQEGVPSQLSSAFKNGKVIGLEDILDAVDKEDVAAIECVEHVGMVLGRSVASLINLFNPDVVVVGGRLSRAERYLMPQLKMNVNKYSLNLVNNDTQIKASRLGSRAGAIGASLMAKSSLLNN